MIVTEKDFYQKKLNKLASVRVKCLHYSPEWMNYINAKNRIDFIVNSTGQFLRCYQQTHFRMESHSHLFLLFDYVKDTVPTYEQMMLCDTRTCPSPLFVCCEGNRRACCFYTTHTRAELIETQLGVDVFLPKITKRIKTRRLVYCTNF